MEDERTRHECVAVRWQSIDRAAMDQVKHWRVTYNHIHNLIRKNTHKVAAEFNPDLLVAIGTSFAYFFA